MPPAFLAEPGGFWTPAGGQTAAGGAPGEAHHGDSVPLLQYPGSGPEAADAAQPAALADLEDGRNSFAAVQVEEDLQRPMTGWLDENQALRRAMQRPSVALLVAVLLVCIAVCVGNWVMNLVGWVMLISSISCGRQQELTSWLLYYLVGVVAEMGLLSLARVCHNKLTQEYDWHAGPGFMRACNICYALLASAIKIFWCVHAQVLVAAAKRDGGCGEAMRHFMVAFSVVVLLRLLCVDTFLSLLAGLVLRFLEAASIRSGVGQEGMQAGGPAKPGTLEAMEQIKFEPRLFDGVCADGSPVSKECCFCLEEFDDEQAIVRTPCRHTMHRECLEKWLHKSHLCPMCRGDLEEATPSTPSTSEES